MAERRSQYRIQPRGESLIASVRTATTKHRGVVLDTSARGARIAFTNAEAPILGVGDCVDVVFSGAQLAGEHTLNARVRARRDNAEHRHYGFEFLHAAPTPDEADGPFNRRQFQRFRPSAVVPVQLQLLDGVSRGAQLRGTVVDLSGGGLSIALPSGAEDRLRDVTQLAMTLRMPGRDAEETRNGQICNRVRAQDGTRYGVQFIGCPTELPGPIYEPAWDCTRCGERALLASSHLHCPGCGEAQRRVPTYFPDWDNLSANDAHRFAGIDRRCSGCSALFSQKARHCGACGTHL